MCISTVGAVSEHLPVSQESGTVADRAPATCLSDFSRRRHHDDH